jgi:hypothetical protein
MKHPSTHISKLSRHASVRRRLAFITVFSGWFALLLAGCEASHRPQAAEEAAPAKSAIAIANEPKDETWDVFYMQGVRAGYTHTVRQTREEGSRTLVVSDVETHLEVARAGQVLDTRLMLRSVETTDGKLVRFETEAQFGPTPVVVRGQVVGNSLEIEQRQGEKSVKQQIPWSPDVLGFSGTEDSLERQPLQPGEHRNLRVLLPIVNQVADDDLAAQDYEETTLLDGTAKLLRIDSTQRMADGTEMKTTLWTDTRGHTLKTRSVVGDQISYRCTKEQALAAAGQPKLDLIESLLVRPKQPLPPTIRAAQRATYLVRLDDGDPVKTFAGSVGQLVTPIDAHSARLTRWAAGPVQIPPRDDLAAESAPGPEYLAASSLLQTDDPAVQELARKVTEGAPRSPQRAVALEQFVYHAIKKKNFSQALASAAEVARSPEGDCTEHAVLLAALARASGIPSRVALGLVYLEPMQGFAFHMWTEVYFAGHWLPLDATMGQGVIDVTHLKLADSSLADGATYNVFLRVMQVVGQLEIELQNVE